MDAQPAFLGLRLRLAALPNRPLDDQVFGLWLDLRLTRTDIILGGAIAVGIVGLATWGARHRRIAQAESGHHDHGLP